MGIHRTSAPATRRKGSCACAWRYLSTMPTASCSPIAAGRSSVIFDAYRIGEGELSVTRDPLQVLSAFEVGIPNVVAFLSAITARSLDLLARRSSGHAALSHVLAGMPERYTDFAHRLRLALHEALRAFSEPSKGDLPHSSSSTTRRTILPRRLSPRLRSNALRASARGKTSSIIGRNSPRSTSFASSINCWRLGSTTK